jgi:hypothetical protein
MSRKGVGVSIVIPSFNNKDKLFRLLDSVRKSSYRPLEVIVVDNSSTDLIIKEGKRKYRWVKWVDLGRTNLGQARAYNIGFACANTKNHVLYCDEDVVLEEDTISLLVSRLNMDQRIGIVTPMILYLSDRNWVNQAGSEVDVWTGRVSVGWGPRSNFIKDKEIQGSGTVMLVRRDLIDKIGGFEDWFLGYTDPDYCVRAQKAGFKNWYESKAVCYHDQPKDDLLWRPRVLSRAYLLGRNRTLFMRKHGRSLFVYLLYLPLILGYYFKESLVFNMVPKWVELVKGTVDGFFYPLNTSLKIPLPKVR